MAQIALHPQEFPEGWTVRTREGVTQPDDTWHPLSRVNPSLISETFRKEIGDFLYTYTAYYQENQIWNGRFSGLAGNYIYQYASEEQARKVGEALVAPARQSPNLFKEYDLPAKNGSVWGWAGKFRGEEGGDVDLFVGTKGPFLILLIVDGPPGEFQRGFEQLVDTWSTGKISGNHLRVDPQDGLSGDVGDDLISAYPMPVTTADAQDDCHL